MGLFDLFSHQQLTCKPGGNLDIVVVVVRESGNRATISIFSLRACCGTIVLISCQYRPCHACHLVRHPHHSHVLRGSSLQTVEPVPKAVILAFDRGQNRTATMDEDSSQIGTAAFADSHHFEETYSKDGGTTWHPAFSADLTREPGSS